MRKFKLLLLLLVVNFFSCSLFGKITVPEVAKHIDKQSSEIKEFSKKQLSLEYFKEKSRQELQSLQDDAQKLLKHIKETFEQTEGNKPEYKNAERNLLNNLELLKQRLNEEAQKLAHEVKAKISKEKDKPVALHQKKKVDFDKAAEEARKKLLEQQVIDADIAQREIAMKKWQAQEEERIKQAEEKDRQGAEERYQRELAQREKSLKKAEEKRIKQEAIDTLIDSLKQSLQNDINWLDTTKDDVSFDAIQEDYEFLGTTFNDFQNELLQSAKEGLNLDQAIFKGLSKLNSNRATMYRKYIKHSNSLKSIVDTVIIDMRNLIKKVEKLELDPIKEAYKKINDEFDEYKKASISRLIDIVNGKDAKLKAEVARFKTLILWLNDKNKDVADQLKQKLPWETLKISSRNYIDIREKALFKFIVFKQYKKMIEAFDQIDKAAKEQFEGKEYKPNLWGRIKGFFGADENAYEQIHEQITKIKEKLADAYKDLTGKEAPKFE